MGRSAVQRERPGGGGDGAGVRRAAKVDNNHSAIVEALRRAGCSVQSLAQIGDGCPDLLVGFRGSNFILEEKTKRGELSQRQVLWHSLWRARVHVVRSPEEALRAVGVLAA